MSAIMLTWIAYATTAEMMLLRVPMPECRSSPWNHFALPISMDCLR